MVVRIVALLLTVVVMTAVANPASAQDRTGGPVPTLIDNAPDSLDLDPAIPVRVVALAAPIAAIVAPTVASTVPPIGRLHAVLVFRPPR